MWKNVPSAHDAAFRGWLTKISAISQGRFAVLAAPTNPSLFKTGTSVAFRGTEPSLKIW
jgi:hypothetical protein